MQIQLLMRIQIQIRIRNPASPPSTTVVSDICRQGLEHTGYIACEQFFQENCLGLVDFSDCIPYDVFFLCCLSLVNTKYITKG
jgi:hypothetical protein